MCSGQGEYVEGRCVCLPGWKGPECNLRYDECEVPDCSGNGHCVDGRCSCAMGFKGEFCQEGEFNTTNPLTCVVECPHPTCSGHGWCVNGTCICQKGWRDTDCAKMDDAALQCLPDCSMHGNFDLESQECVCEPQWTGSECDKSESTI
ncbi:hypothetical protein HAZT_HAZT005296 [Hyalella azteca]|uniref:EGF-like domain-containing protein n=1 Tax=Hyalella azteca TaxID=294128 RepID=A0A6A0GWM9_HYAAZ|nr:hypothetical protein HAZT_HAZT005296 [Hyalella azteca]